MRMKMVAIFNLSSLVPNDNGWTGSLLHCLQLTWNGL
jgi:hypothetical protein